MATKENKTAVFQAIDPEFNRILQVLANAKFRVSDTSLNSRIMNYYEEKGLLYSTREKTLGWRKFDAYELVWLDILDQLRVFGYPLENIKKIKDSFLSKNAGTVDEKGQYETRPFEWFIALSLTTKSQFYLIVMDDGDATFYDDRTPHIWNIENSWMRKPHISIPLTPIIEDMWNTVNDEKPVEFKKPDLVTITKSEKEILKDIRSGKFEKLMSNLKIKSLNFL